MAFETLKEAKEYAWACVKYGVAIFLAISLFGCGVVLALFVIKSLSNFIGL